jgi:hypothetical protein
VQSLIGSWGGLIVKVKSQGIPVLFGGCQVRQPERDSRIRYYLFGGIADKCCSTCSRMSGCCQDHHFAYGSGFQ